MNQGCEIQFIYKEKNYGIFLIDTNKFLISDDYNELSEKLYKNAADILQYLIEDRTLGDILDDIKITFRTF